MGRDAGVSERQLLALTDHSTSHAFSPLERRVLDYAEALTETPATATDELVEALRQDFDDEQVVELTAMIAWDNFRARFNRGFDIDTQDYSEGAVCAIPQRSNPTP